MSMVLPASESDDDVHRLLDRLRQRARHRPCRVGLRPRDMAAVLELGEALAVSIPRSEAHVIRHFLDRMRYGLFVPEVPSE